MDDEIPEEEEYANWCRENEKGLADLMDEFPGNSNKKRQEQPPPKEKKKKDERPEVKKVISGEVIEKKKTFGSKIKDVFIGGEFKSATSYIAAEVLLPAVRNMIVEATTKGIERMIYGDSTPRRSPGPGRPRVMYNSPVERYTPQSRGYLPGQSGNVRPRHGAPDIILNTYEDAEIVVESMAEMISDYGYASLSDLKNLVELPTSYTDESWGWTTIREFSIRQNRGGGFILNIPNMESLS